MSKWGIANPGGWYTREEEMLASARPPTPNASDNAQQRQVLLVDKNGKPLVTREPRPVGFRKVTP